MVSSSDQNTVEYEGSTYTYNDHLSNYLFMGIDSSEEVSNMESQMDAGQADSIFVVSLDQGRGDDSGAFYSERYDHGDRGF